ncbi:hypothetical protein HMPREF1553_00012 [Porphyromonas gingivalis F0568]|nr:hypothetical protein HMPREF1553_00012 [Porphyromonas gingivalis F0568]
MHAGMMGLGYSPCAQIGMRNQGIDQRAFANPRMAGKECQLAIEQGFEIREAFARNRRHVAAGVTYGGVDSRQPVQLQAIFLRIAVYFVEYKNNRYAIGFCRCEETIDKDGGSHRIVDGTDQHGSIQIGSQYMGLFREVAGSPDDIIASGMDSFDVGRLSVLRSGDNLHAIAYGYGIGGADAFQTQIAFRHAV